MNSDMNSDMNGQVQEELEDIARKTRVVPVTMLAAVLLTLGVLGGFAFGVWQDSEDGSLLDGAGVIGKDGEPVIPGG